MCLNCVVEEIEKNKSGYLFTHHGESYLFRIKRDNFSEIVSYQIKLYGTEWGEYWESTKDIADRIFYFGIDCSEDERTEEANKNINELINKFCN